MWVLGALLIWPIVWVFEFIGDNFWWFLAGLVAFVVGSTIYMFWVLASESYKQTEAYRFAEAKRQQERIIRRTMRDMRRAARK